MVAGSVEKAKSSDLKNLLYILNSKPRLGGRNGDQNKHSKEKKS